MNPIKTTMGDLFVAVGVPGRLAFVRAVQLVVMIIGLFTLGLPFGITGVAVAVDIMLLVGVIILLAQARRYVQFSVIRMFLIPTLAVVLSVLFGRL
ncbi:MAG: hypothetical protein GWN00_31220, partial [Aliifodinibius sp.]|nr:hypothetical protein [Fodinibius sp.]NIY29096.1 hypothetical protein [Fodinibius sp.]